MLERERREGRRETEEKREKRKEKREKRKEKREKRKEKREKRKEKREKRKEEREKRKEKREKRKELSSAYGWICLGGTSVVVKGFGFQTRQSIGCRFGTSNNRTQGVLRDRDMSMQCISPPLDNTTNFTLPYPVSFEVTNNDADYTTSNITFWYTGLLCVFLCIQDSFFHCFLVPINNMLSCRGTKTQTKL